MNQLENHILGPFPVGLKLLARKVFIYGLFDGSRCRYIGQTWNPRKRLLLHVRSPGGKIFKHGPLKMKVIRECSESDASRLERQIVFAYRNKNQCDLNASNSFTSGSSRKFGFRPQNKQANKYAQDLAHLARGVPKKFTGAERERRRQRLAEARKKRWEKKL